MLLAVPAPVTVPRRVSLPVEEAALDNCPVPGVQLNQWPFTWTNVVLPAVGGTPALALFYKGVRDSIDFGIDVRDWLKANYGSTLKTAVWAAAGDSPMAPTISSQLISPVKEAIVVLSGGAIDDVYHLDCTLTFDVTQPTDDNAAIMPQRILVRRIHVKVVDR